jgi:cytochrome P450
MAKEGTQNGTASPCFCVDMIKTQEKQGFSDAHAAYNSGPLLETGSDTTSSTLYAFVQAMILFPDVQKSPQEEIDMVVDSGRLPTMDDEPDLQYVRSCIKEFLRWMPTTIMGAVPHAVTKGDEHLGYRIPKGAGVLNNVYTANMDPKRYPHLWQFNPDRYRDDRQSILEAANNADASKRDQYTFNAGRYICPGLHVAERSLFLGIKIGLGFQLCARDRPCHWKGDNARSRKAHTRLRPWSSAL